MINTILFIGFSETIVILVLAVMLFGADKLPEFARMFGRAIRQVKNASDDLKREIMNPIDQVKKDVKKGIDAPIDEIKNQVKQQTKEANPFEQVKKEVSDAQKEIEAFKKGPIKRE